MILLDLNQVMISNLMMSVKNNSDIQEDLVRHMILNTIRSLRKKFSAEYGELVIACDDTNYWRKQLFPYYKASRKKTRKDSPMDWNNIFQILNMVRDELKEYFPYRVIQIETAEADDIIATLVQDENEKVINNSKTLILSGDKDFIQLHKYDNIKQYDPTRKKFISHKNPSQYIKEHIMRGDTGDGIPNFLSHDATFVDGSRSKSIFAEKLKKWIDQDPKEFCNEETLRNYNRNKMLIDLDYIPTEIKEKVRESYRDQEGKKSDKLFNYFIKKRLKNLMQNINDF